EGARADEGDRRHRRRQPSPPAGRRGTAGSWCREPQGPAQGGRGPEEGGQGHRIRAEAEGGPARQGGRHGLTRSTFPMVAAPPPPVPRAPRAGALGAMLLGASAPSVGERVVLEPVAQ